MAASRSLSIVVVAFCLCGLSTDGFMLQQRHRLRTTGLQMKKASNKSKPTSKPSGSSAKVAAGAAGAPLSAGPSGESQEPSTTPDASKTGSVPSSAAAASTAPAFSYRKTFWQPFLDTATTADPSAATPAAQNVPKGFSPAFDPPPLPNRKSFWQPYYSPPTAAAAAAAGAPQVAADSAPPAAVAELEPPATAETESPMKEAPTAEEEVSVPTTSAAAPDAEVVPPPQPAAAAEAASSPPPPPPPPPAPPAVAFEPAPTLISDSPVYKDVAMTIERAKKSLAPFQKKVQDNVAEGTVGERGEEWVIAQGAILIFVAMGSVPIVGGLVMALAGPGLLAGGVGFMATGVKDLGKSLSPWPAPVKDNELNTDGVYGVVRHPMYTGLVMFCIGFGVVTNSPLRMLLAALLAVVLDKKAEKEESLLVDLHGEVYESYREAVAKFVPRIY